jgi:hypothetical protein
MRALVGAIPRCYRDHRSKVALDYRTLVEAKLERLGQLPKDASPVLREWGRVSMDLGLIGQRLDAVRGMKQPRKAELRRLQSESRKLRVQLLMLERRLDEMAAANPGHPDLARQILEMQRG